MKKILYPIISFFVSVIMLFITTFFDNTKQELWFYVAVAVWMTLVAGLSFLFSKKHLLKTNHLKYTFIYSLTLAALLVVVYYLCTHSSTNANGFYFGFIAFAWTEMWALLGFSASNGYSKITADHQIRDSKSPLRIEVILFPIIAFIASLNPVLMINGLPGDLGDILVALVIIFFWIVCFVPAFSFLYSYKILKNSNRKIRWTTLSSFATCAASAVGPLILEIKKIKWRYDTPWEMWSTQILEALIFMVMLFTWSELWGLLGVIKQQSARNKAIDTPDSYTSEEKNNNDTEKSKKLLYVAFSFILSLFIGLVLWIWRPNNSSVFIIKRSLYWAWLILLIPVSSFLYSKIALKKSKNRIGYTFLNSLAVFIAYALIENKVNINSLIIFAWCEIWGLIGLIKKRDKNKDEIPSEQ